VRILVSAGYNKSKAAIAICEIVRRSGHEVAGILVVSPYNIRRLRQLVVQRGMAGLRAAIKKLAPSATSTTPDQLQTYFDELDLPSQSLSDWAAANQVDLLTVTDLNSDNSVDFVTKSNCDALIYGGGGILRKRLIEATGRKVLNPHCGPLPEIRGMNAIEWALLLDKPLEITVHYIDEGIDTGEIVSRVALDTDRVTTIEELRGTAVVGGIKELARLLSAHGSLDSFPSLETVNAPPPAGSAS